MFSASWEQEHVLLLLQLLLLLLLLAHAVYGKCRIGM
jgi:hypothetical protein